MRREEYFNLKGKSPDAWIVSQQERESSGDEEFDRQVKGRWDEFRPKPRDFKGIYSREEISRDEEKVAGAKKREDLIDREGKRLEYEMMEGAGGYDWFGPECQVVPGSEYDDRLNRTDIILIFNRESGEPVKLAVDVTTSEDGSRLNRKIDGLVEHLRNGRLQPAKYFADENGEAKGNVFLPRVVIGTNREEEGKLFEDFKKTLRNKKEEGPKLAVHALQRELLAQMQRQLITYLEKSVSTLIMKKFRERSPVITRLTELLTAARQVKLENEPDSPEFKDLIDFLTEKKDQIAELVPEGEKELGDSRTGLVGNIYKHLEAARVIGEVVKKKSSLGIEPPKRAKNYTERKLSIEDKELILAS